MRFALVLALLSLTQAAPVKIVTRTHTAEPVTVWQTFTTNTVTVTGVVAVSSPPPGATDVAKAVSEILSSAEEEVAETSTSTEVAATTPVEVPTTSTAIPETTTSTPVEVPETTSTTPVEIPTTTSTPVEVPTTTSTTPVPETTSTTPVPETTSTTAPSTTSSTAAAQSSSSTLNDFEQEILNEHNIKRDLHGVQHLVWDASLAEYAANYAASSFSCDNVQLVHSHGPYGENLAAGYTGGASPVDAWYDEISMYDFNNPGFSEATGHFTQVVWKSTEKVGCAKVTCNNAWRQYTICEYSDSRGNVVGTDSATGVSYFAENVVRPVSS